MKYKYDDVVYFHAYGSSIVYKGRIVGMKSILGINFYKIMRDGEWSWEAGRIVWTPEANIVDKLYNIIDAGLKSVKEEKNEGKKG